MWRSLASNAFTVLLVAMTLLAGAIIWGQREYAGAGPLTRAICLQVERGSNMARVSRELEARGAVRSGMLMRVGAGYANKNNKLKAGSFLIPAESSIAQIVDQVTRSGASTCGTEVVFRVGVTRIRVELRELDPETGRYVERAQFDPADDTYPQVYARSIAQADTRLRIALAEGVTSWQVVEGLRAIDVLRGEVETIPDEGALAPDSYEFVRDADRVSILARMQEAQQRRIAQVWEARAEGLPLKTPEEMLVLASIVEKETGLAAERRQVASVFVNRLRKGMLLQTDPTVIYGITRGKAPLGRGLRQSELRRETPWNTYVIAGLPPTPIANPGLASMQAAVDPDGTDFLFFVADGTGGHAFAKTLAEHNRNVANWRRIEAERASSGN